MLPPTGLPATSAAVEPFLPVLLGVALIGAGCYRLVPELRRHRREPIDVHEAPQTDGNVTIRGTAVAEDETLDAPFTAIDCLAYRYKVKQERPGKGKSWKIVANGGEFVPFRLKDDTGSLLVDPDDDDAFAYTTKWEAKVGADETVQGHAREFLESEGIEPGEASDWGIQAVGDLGGDRRRYLEYRLEPGEPVTVNGPVEYDAEAAREWGSGAVNAAVRPTEEGDLAIADAAELPLLRSDVYVPGGVALAGAALVGWASLSVAGVL